MLVADLHDSSTTTRWPVFAAAVAAETLVGALFALPLQWGAVNLGVLDLYRAIPGAFSRPQHDDALTAADTAALMLLSHRTDAVGDGAHGDGAHGDVADHDGDGSDWFEHGLGHRAEIHQATGMVLVQLGIDATDALARLRGYAFAHRRLLLDVARDVDERRLVFTEDMT